MLRLFAVAVCLCGITFGVWGDDVEEKIMSIENDTVICGPAKCPLNECAMCFYTSKFSRDSKNVSFITSCGTCLNKNGSTLKESCATESTTLTNYTDRISINLLNSTVDSAKVRNGVVGLMLSEMSQTYSAFIPSPYVTTPSPPQQQPIVVVQPPAQYITVNSGGPYERRTDYDLLRFGRNNPNNPCEPPSPDCTPRKLNVGNHPNELPPQADKIFRIMANMANEVNQVNAALSDALAGNSIGFLAEGPPTGTYIPGAKAPFPVWTPSNGKK